MKTDTLDELLAIINSGVATIKQAYAEADKPLPNIDELYTPDGIEESVTPTIMLVVAAASQLISTLRHPGHFVWQQSFAPALHCAAIGTIMKAHVPELVREAGPQGAHVKDVCTPTGTNPAKMARLLRLLASRHIFREVEPDVFVNNRLSSVLDTGKSSQEILANPVNKYQGGRGMASLVDVCANDWVRGATFIPECMMDPTWSASEEQSHAPFSRAHNHHGNLWEWFTKPGNEAALSRFNEGMAVYAKLHPSYMVLDGFPWADITAGSLIVDVGGGVGSAVLALHRKHGHLKYAVQDLPPVIEGARAYWDRECPNAIENHHVLLQEQNFFDPQPNQDVGVFVLRQITHNWSTQRNRDILRRLSEVAKPGTRVLIIEYIIPYTNAISGDEYAHIPGAKGYQAPTPLLPSAGSESIYETDILMLNLLNAQERTVGDFVEMVQGTGWAVERIYRGIRPNAFCQVVLAPTT